MQFSYRAVIAAPNRFWAACDADTKIRRRKIPYKTCRLLMISEIVLFTQKVTKMQFPSRAVIAAPNGIWAASDADTKIRRPGIPYKTCRLSTIPGIVLFAQKVTKMQISSRTVIAAPNGFWAASDANTEIRRPKIPYKTYRL